jgi:hypothetical protein
MGKSNNQSVTTPPAQGGENTPPKNQTPAAEKPAVTTPPAQGGGRTIILADGKKYIVK